MSDLLPKATPWVPDDLCAAIGMVITRHSYLEMMLQHISYEIAGVDDATGRVAFREPRLVDRLSMIGELAKLHGVDLDAETVRKLKHDLPHVTRIRDQLAHGVFFTHDKSDDLYIGVVSGSWRPDGPRSDKVSRKMQPPAYRITADQLVETVAVLHSMIDACRDLRAAVAAQKSRTPQ